MSDCTVSQLHTTHKYADLSFRVLKSVNYHQNLVQFLGICVDYQHGGDDTLSTVVVVSDFGRNLADYVQDTGDFEKGFM